jgi:hypothetical protein
MKNSGQSFGIEIKKFLKGMDYDGEEKNPA